MTQTIKITSTTYSRLENIAKGFGKTPEAVIIRLLDDAEGKVDTRPTPNVDIRPTLTFYPNDENLFKDQLIENKEAEVVLYKVDGSKEVMIWRANRFRETSNLRGNIGGGFLRDWESKGIKSAEFSIKYKSTR